MIDTPNTTASTDIAYVPVPDADDANNSHESQLSDALMRLRTFFYTSEGSDRIPTKARLLFAVLLSAMGALFYLEGTEDAKWYERSNSIIANFFMSLFATNASMDYFSDRNNSLKRVAALSAASAFAYSPQVIISIYGSNDPIPLRVLIAITTLLSGIGSYAYSIAELMHYTKVIKRSITGQFEGIKTVSTNLDHCVERLAFASFDETTQLNTPGDWLALAEKTPEKWVPSERLLLIINGSKKLLQTAAAFWLLLGDTGYMCDTANDLNRFFDLPASAAAVISAIMMVCELMFNVIAGVYLGELLVDAPLKLLRYRKLPHTLTIDNSTLKYICYFSPIIAGILSYGSSFTAVNVLDTCPNTKFNMLLFPNMQDVVRLSTEAGNGIFTMMAILDLANRYVKNSDTLVGKLLTILETLSALREEVTLAPSHDVVVTRLKDENITDNGITQLSTNGFFSNNRLLPNQSATEESHLIVNAP